MYINSPGGVITSGLSILDTMNYLKCDVSTVCFGQAASMGAVLLANGAPFAKRTAPILAACPKHTVETSHFK